MTESLSYGAFFNRSLRLTHHYYAQLLPYTLLLGFYYFIVAVLNSAVPNLEQNQTQMVLMGAWFLFAPLLAGYIFFHEQTVTKKNPTLIEGLKTGFERLLPLFGALLALILLPGLFVGIMLGVYLFALKMNVSASWVPIGLGILSLLGCALIMNSKILSLSLVMNTPSDSTMCVEQSSQLVHNHYFRTLFRSTVMFLTLILLLFSPLVIVPFIKQTLLLKITVYGGVAVLISLLTPYLWSFIVIDMHDLEKKRLKRAAQDRKEMQSKIKEAPKAHIKEDDWL